MSGNIEICVNLLNAITDENYRWSKITNFSDEAYDKHISFIIKTMGEISYLDLSDEDYKAAEKATDKYAEQFDFSTRPISEKAEKRYAKSGLAGLSTKPSGFPVNSIII